MVDNHGTDGRQTQFLFKLNGYHKKPPREEATNTRRDSADKRNIGRQINEGEQADGPTRE